MLALIIPLSGIPGLHPEHPIVLPPPSIWPSPGYPAHPIAPGGSPPGIWGGAGGLPPWVMPPIYYPPGGGGGSPPGFWGPPGPWPTPPIAMPPSIWPPGGNPPGGGGGSPPGFWGPPGPWPTPPINLPGGGSGGGDGKPPNGGGNKLDWKVAWSPQTGWIIVAFPGEGATVPMPSSPPADQSAPAT